MAEQIKISQNAKMTHLGDLCELAANADRLVLVSPFLSINMGNLISKMPSIKRVDLYTNLDGFEQSVSVVKSLTAFAEYCEKHNIALNMFYDDSLHGKVYLFYKGDTPKGFLTTSANFTDKGLEKNLEFGILIHDDILQIEMMESVKSAVQHTLSAAHLEYLYGKAQDYQIKHP